MASFGIYEIPADDLLLIDLRLEEVDLSNPDDLIRVFEKTLEYVSPEEYWSIRAAHRWKSPEEVPEVHRKEQIWHIRWSIANRLPKSLAEKRRAGEDVSQYLDWIHEQLIRSFKVKSDVFPEPHGISESVLDWVLGKIIPLVSLPEAYDSEVLGEFMFSMGYYDVYDARTWEFLLKIKDRLRNEGFTQHLLLLAKIYKEYHPAGLKEYLEKKAAENESEGDERHQATVKVARVIIQGKKLKLASPPYSVGIAIDE